jgi:uncharacterized protein YciI
MPIFAVEYSYTDATIPGRDTHRPTHRSWLLDLVDNGTVLSSGPYPDGSGALLLFRTENVDALRELLSLDPFAVENLIERTAIREWLPVMGAFSE